MSLMDLTAVTLGEKIKRREVSAVEAVMEALAAVEADAPRLNSFLTVDAEGALRRAEACDCMIRRGELTSPLAGVPFSAKDNLCTEGLRTTCGSRMLADFVPSYTAEAVRLAEQAGAILLGKTNMDEFAMGSTTETSAFGATANPWKLTHAAGGSSGGSCAAVAAEECSFSLGTDTGGSIRQPSAFCGVTGIKPTYGTVSRYGLIAYGSSLDQVGVTAKDVTDCAAVLEQLAVHDPKDSTSLHRKDTDFTAALTGDVKGMRIGIPTEYFSEGLQPEVAQAVLAAADVLADQGAVVEECTLGYLEYAVPAYYVIACAEAGSNLARFDGVKYGHRAASYEDLHEMYRNSRSEGFGAEVKRRIMLGTFVLSEGFYDAYYLKAARVRSLICRAFSEAFARYDILLAPCTPSGAPALGTSLQDPMQMYLGDIYTVSANLAGLPAMSVPCGMDRDGLPIGMQLIGNRLREADIFKAAYAYERTRPYRQSTIATSRNGGVQ